MRAQPIATFLVASMLPVFSLASGCDQSAPGDDDSSVATQETASAGGADDIEDDFPSDVPAVDANTRQIEFPEQIILPGTEVQTCYFMDPEEADLYATALDSFQGKFGHHAVLFYTVAPEPSGTVRDCTSVADMVTLIPAMAPIRFGIDKFPEGMAVRIGKGTQLVVQQHYLNTSDKAIRVRDVLQLRTSPREDVDILAGFFGLSNVDFVLADDASREQTVSFECAAPRDMNLLMIGAHMHEWGTRLTTDIAAADKQPEQVISVDPWKAEFRDEPPIQEFSMDAPLVLKEGDKIHTDCVFSNTAGKELSFPSEMCAVYGYYFPAPEGSETWTCDGKVD